MISQSNKYHSGITELSRNRVVKEFELSKNGIWQKQLVCGKLCTEEVIVIMIKIATSLQ